jgi:hypothetical protein
MKREIAEYVVVCYSC